MSSAPDTGDDREPAVDTQPSSRPARPAWRAAIAPLALVALVVATVAVVASRGGDDELRALPLVPGAAGAERAADAAIFPAPTYRFVLEGALADLGGTGTVRRARAHDLDERRAAEIARAVGVDATPQLADGAWQASGDGGSVWISTFGGLSHVSYTSYTEGTPYAERGSSGAVGGGTSGAVGDDPGTIDEPAPPPDLRPIPPVAPVDLPSEEQAEAIARDVLDSFGALDGAEWRVEVTDSGAVGIAVACPDDTVTDVRCDELEAESVVTSRSVQLTRVVDGMPVAGLTWWVEVGDGGRIDAINGSLTSLETVGDYPLQSVAAAYDVLVAGDGWWGGPAILDAAGTETADTPERRDAPDVAPEITVTITGAERALVLQPAWEDGAESTYLVPAYRFVGRFADGGGDYSAEVPALAPEYVATPEPTTPRPDPAPEPEPVPEPTPLPEPVPGEDPTGAPRVGGDVALDVGVAYTFDLLTHCGVSHGFFDGRWWRSEAAIEAPAASAPEGWDDPYETGTLVLVDAELAEFTAGNGDTLVFTPAPSDFEPPGCQ